MANLFTTFTEREKRAFDELEGHPFKAIVKLHNYRFPTSHIVSGEYAVIILDVGEVIEGTLFPTFVPKRQIIAVGNMPKLEPNEEYIYTGELVKDRLYGVQYKTTNIRLNYDLSTTEDQQKFFKFFLTDKQIELLMQHSENPLQLLEDHDIQTLCKIKGIGPFTAEKMCAKYESCKDNGRAYVELQGLDLTKNAIDKLIFRYGSPDLAINKVNENPYILIKEVKGYGWKKADAIAQKKGFKTNSTPRILAFTRYYLEQQGDINGNSWVSIEDLLNPVFNECAPVDAEELKNIIKHSMVSNLQFDELYKAYLERGHHLDHKDDRFLYFDKETKRVGLLSLRFLEKDIANNLIRLSKANSSFQYDRQTALEIIKNVENEQGYDYTEEQKNAIFKILDNNVTILTGSAGTGKTSSMLAVTRILQHYNQEIEQCALSGRASSNLTDITGLDGKTIHRLLKFNPELEGFLHTENNPLTADTIVLDEVSMVGGDLFYSLISAIKTGAKLVMIGDSNQLEAIGLCNLLNDMMQSGLIPIARLSKIHRQAARSGIIINANHACNGHSIVKENFLGSEIRGELQDFKLISNASPEGVVMDIINEYKRFIEHYSAKDIQVIVPMRTRGNISCRELNNILQNLANPKGNNPVTVTMQDGLMTYNVTFKEGDRIIIQHNDYHAKTLTGESVAIFNGNIGYIKSINPEYMVIQLREQGEIILERKSWNNVQLGYCCTVHKTQGSTIPYVIFGLNNTCYTMLSKELVYTAITRAKKWCTVCTQPKIMGMACHNSKVKLKQTWLKDDLYQQYLIDIKNEGGFKDVNTTNLDNF